MHEGTRHIETEEQNDQWPTEPAVPMPKRLEKQAGTSKTRWNEDQSQHVACSKLPNVFLGHHGWSLVKIQNVSWAMKELFKFWPSTVACQDVRDMRKQTSSTSEETGG